MDDCLRDSPEELADHSCFEFLRDTIESFLNDMTSEGIHAQSNSVAPDGISNPLNLLLRSVLKASLNEEVSESINHELVRLCHNSVNNRVLLISGTNLKLLLQED